MVLGVESSSWGGACLADRHCGGLLSYHFGAESAEAVGKFENMLASYTFFVSAVDGVCEPSMWAVGLIVVAVLLFLDPNFFWDPKFLWTDPFRSSIFF